MGRRVKVAGEGTQALTHRLSVVEKFLAEKPQEKRTGNFPWASDENRPIESKERSNSKNHH